MRISIWVGIAVTFVLQGIVLVVSAYLGAPRFNETWEEQLSRTQNTGIYTLRWAIGHSAAATVLDIYIFVLPLPIIYRLNLALRWKIQVAALFFVALL